MNQFKSAPLSASSRNPASQLLVTLFPQLDMPPTEIVDDTAAFQKLVEKLTFYQNIIHANQPFLTTRARTIQEEIAAMSIPTTGHKQDQMKNLENMEAFCREEPNSIDE
jgi:hypothetical protein